MSSMEKAIVASLAIAVIIGVVVLAIRYLNRQQSNDQREQYELEKLVHAAAGVMRRLGTEGDIEDVDALSLRSQQNVGRWLESYEQYQWRRRGLGGAQGDTP